MKTFHLDLFAAFPPRRLVTASTHHRHGDHIKPAGAAQTAHFLPLPPNPRAPRLSLSSASATPLALAAARNAATFPGPVSTSRNRPESACQALARRSGELAARPQNRLAETPCVKSVKTYDCGRLNETKTRSGVNKILTD